MERVDKGWQERGIDCYSTPAILGTLAHYGVTVDEAGFRELAGGEFPLAIAQAWHERWTGKGQFTRFPAAAAEELWRRLCEGQLAPTDLALAIINLLRSLDEALSGKPDDGTRETRFKVVEAYLPKLAALGARRDAFMAELTAALGDWIDVLDRMAEALAKKGLDAQAERFVAFEEALIPERAGVARALVRAERGDRAGAVGELKAIAADAARSDSNRLAAADALFELDDFETGRAVTLELLDKAQRERDLELGADAVQRLQKLLEKNPRTPDRKALRERVEAMIAAFK